MSARRLAILLAATTALAVALAACAHAPGGAGVGVPSWRAAPVVTDATLALWSFDETTGLTFADSSANHRDGVLGIDTRVAFGRFHNARQFTASINSFALVRADHAPRLGDTWTIEAWIDPTAYGAVECSVIAARWTEQAGEQSWMMGLTGFDHAAVASDQPRPNLFAPPIVSRAVGLLVFVYQPENAGEPQALTSTVAVELGRWTHVTVTQEGHELRLFIDGRLDAQFATASRLRDSSGPLAIGNLIDAQWLTESQGSLRVPDDSIHYPFYAFEGLIDEVQISNATLGSGAGK